MTSLQFHVKRKRGHGKKPGEIKARQWTQWLAFKAKSDARSDARARKRAVA